MAFDVSVIRPEMRVEQVKSRGRDSAPAGGAESRRGCARCTRWRSWPPTSTSARSPRRPSAAEHTAHGGHVQRDDSHAGLPDQALRVRVQAQQDALDVLDGGIRLRSGFAVARPRRILKTGIWVESKAVHHYAAIARRRRVGRRDPGLRREGPGRRVGHVERWRRLLEHPEEPCVLAKGRRRSAVDHRPGTAGGMLESWQVPTARRERGRTERAR